MPKNGVSNSLKSTLVNFVLLVSFLGLIIISFTLSFTLTITLSGFLGFKITCWVSSGLSKDGLPPNFPFSLLRSALYSHFTKSRFKQLSISINDNSVILSGAIGFKSLTYLKKCLISLPASSSVSASNFFIQSE